MALPRSCSKAIVRALNKLLHKCDFERGLIFVLMRSSEEIDSAENKKNIIWEKID